tara:strand:+ start:230 stop:364 length:135 start_codon:yes stop_codon:yes gene_type:complete
MLGITFLNQTFASESPQTLSHPITEPILFDEILFDGEGLVIETD